jgi:hypothetical protein
VREYEEGSRSIKEISGRNDINISCISRRIKDKEKLIKSTRKGNNP